RSPERLIDVRRNQRHRGGHIASLQLKQPLDRIVTPGIDRQAVERVGGKRHDAAGTQHVDGGSDVRWVRTNGGDDEPLHLMVSCPLCLVYFTQGSPGPTPARSRSAASRLGRAAGASKSLP